MKDSWRSRLILSSDESREEIKRGYVLAIRAHCERVVGLEPLASGQGLIVSGPSRVHVESAFRRIPTVVCVAELDRNGSVVEHPESNARVTVWKHRWPREVRYRITRVIAPVGSDPDGLKRADVRN
jgi:hypothetical protein